ncbi:MAG TPA: dTDP-4-dehydrorhamnose 3,5-epimerase [Pyrinomonadaceae bacterium]|nr:dTDP-4-dehydrorhamnose 3,5-epimerase [Pyrinomonadaceae bacterium]
MQIKPRKLDGVFEIKLERIGDERGYFMRFYDREIFVRHNLQTVWEQESVSFNQAKDTVRGLHFQMPPLVETKIVRVAAGAIWDVFVDLRKDSETYGEWDALELSAENNLAVYIPKGFAHGFRTLAENTIVEYKIDVPYQSDLASGIRWNDQTLNIDWRIENPIISARDAEQQFFISFDSPF